MITNPKAKQPVSFIKNMYEMQLWERKLLVIGLDEVGRGCLAGPLVTAAVALPIGVTHLLLKDSKLMSLQERLTAYQWITSHCFYQVGIVHHRIIDQYNIYQATLLAMKKALVNLLFCLLPDMPGAILVDAMPLSLSELGLSIPVYSFEKGEQKSSSIAAASIVAKVTRDALMDRYETLFPGYELNQHKGYATGIHQSLIHKLGPSIIHRESFLGAIRTEIEAKENQQQTLF